MHLKMLPSGWCDSWRLELFSQDTGIVPAAVVRLGTSWDGGVVLLAGLLYVYMEHRDQLHEAVCYSSLEEGIQSIRVCLLYSGCGENVL